MAPRDVDLDDLLEPADHSGDPRAPDVLHLLDEHYREAGQRRAGRWLRGRWQPPDDDEVEVDDGDPPDGAPGGLAT